MRRVVFYNDQAGQIRWRMIASNNKIVADSAEGYDSLAGARNGLRVVTGIALGLATDFLYSQNALGDGENFDRNRQIEIVWPCIMHKNEAECEERHRKGCHS